MFVCSLATELKLVTLLQVSSNSRTHMCSSSGREASAVPCCCTSPRPESVRRAVILSHSAQHSKDERSTGQITIMDHDTVELSNLHRQVLHTEDRVGISKAESAKQALVAYVPSRFSRDSAAMVVTPVCAG